MKNNFIHSAMCILGLEFFFTVFYIYIGRFWFIGRYSMYFQKASGSAIKKGKGAITNECLHNHRLKSTF